MQFDLKTILRVVFLVVLIYALAAMLGAVPGFSVGSKTRRCRRGPRRPGFRYTGMVGELIQTSGSGSAPAGTPVLF
jgi:hypothetical protein